MLHDIKTSQEVTYEKLTKIGKVLVTADIVNFSLAKTGGGFPDTVADEVIKHVKVDKNTKILLIEDLYFILVNKLVEFGANLRNIYLAFGEFKQKNVRKNSMEPIYTENSTQYDIMKQLSDSLFSEKLNIITLKEAFEMKKFDLIIANPPYGPIGAGITKQIIKELDFDIYLNLEPSNDYFIAPYNTYRYVDLSMKPELIRGAFADVAQTTAVTKISKQLNNNSEIDSRLALSVEYKDQQAYHALSELWRNTAKVGALSFKQTGASKDLKYDKDIFTFNSGAFDIHNGYFAVANKGKWTKATLYNIYHQTVNGNMVISMVRGCEQFKRLIYSELGLKMLKLWFSASPEGWGLINGMFANIDYSKCNTWQDVFDYLHISKNNQSVLIAAAEAMHLSNKEIEICTIVKEIN